MRKLMSATTRMRVVFDPYTLIYIRVVAWSPLAYTIAAAIIVDFPASWHPLADADCFVVSTRLCVMFTAMVTAMLAMTVLVVAR